VENLEEWKIRKTPARTGCWFKMYFRKFLY